MNKLILKPGREKAVKQRHHWIFSGAVQQYPENCNGDIVPVVSADNSFLGCAYCNRKSNIVARMISFDEIDPLKAIQDSLEAAVDLRQQLFVDDRTNAYRLINAEGDSLPGLIVD